MAGQGISNAFLDWAKARIVAVAAPTLPSSAVFDERDKDLASHISQAVNSGLGCCAVISCAEISREGETRPDNTQYRVSAEVSVLRNAALSSVDSVELAERLFRSFAGAEFNISSVFPVNVGANNLKLTATAGTKWMHIFTIDFITQI